MNDHAIAGLGLCSADPTNAELEAAWKVLQVSGVEAISGISTGELKRIINDRNGRGYSAAEWRMAAGLIVLRAKVERWRKWIASRRCVNPDWIPSDAGVMGGYYVDCGECIPCLAGKALCDLEG